ncbi:MAG: hypothetical protein IPN49_15715 [Saprospiraceae bacterium]|nr:hypothetical protein [Saprospiraceae bacterium]
MAHPGDTRLLCSIEKLTVQFKEVYLNMFHALQNTHQLIRFKDQYITLQNELKDKVFNVNIQPPFQNLTTLFNIWEDIRIG